MKDVLFKGDAMSHMYYWLHTDRKMLDKIYDLLKDIGKNGVAKGIGKPEKLKYREGWSRRITDEHRLVYTMKEKIIYVISCKGHYE